jgi:hypothetical protein
MDYGVKSGPTECLPCRRVDIRLEVIMKTPALLILLACLLASCAVPPKAVPVVFTPPVVSAPVSPIAEALQVRPRVRLDGLGEKARVASHGRLYGQHAPHRGHLHGPTP